MCRGNQSRDVFETQADADLFIRTLGEMCVRNEVLVHAWCLMTNHYHLLLETPQGNLVDAMKWLQGTFTQRYNARNKLCGHLFQGRYKAKIIDAGDPSYFRKVGEYIHLNPSEAGLVKSGRLGEYLWSSYPLYLKPPSRRPAWQRVTDVLTACGILADTPAGRRAYGAYMDVRQLEVSRFEAGSLDALEWKRMERGWIHGSNSFRDRMVACLTEMDDGAAGRSMDVDQKQDLSEAAARVVLERCLIHFSWTKDDLKRMKKSDPRKMLIAGLLRYHFPVKAKWLSEILCMGHFTTVSRAMRFYDHPANEWVDEKIEILKFIG
jgi:REP element-mobilizing transposase RayT